MRILQIIDSLEAGGAERMAVNYANALANEMAFSGLVISRKEGPLLNQLNSNVSYLFLNKKSVIDIQSVMKLRKFVIQNTVEIIHAHSTSFFLAFLLKLTYPTVKLIWHDHYGDSEFLSKRPSLALKFVLPFFNGIIAVNQNLKNWAEQKLHFKNVVYLPNFPSDENNASEQTILQGIQGKRIVSLANLRVQKNHFLLLEVAKKIKISHPEWTFHLVGKDFEDEYSKQIKSLILDFNLEDIVFVHGSRNDIKNILEQSTIGILTSQSEGLPVALLEYGLYEKPVVVTNVGEIPLVIQDGINGFSVETNSGQLFYDSLVKLIENDSLRLHFGKELQKTIEKKYSKKTVLHQYSNWIALSI
ncbi:glycosyltransferase family 4 protein [Flavobacterium franklandianum]|uniref:glycosyltransferase family 4 protein n=1 Tax=Flavobacterium franklandianum TaxID=2594430 RepID=UPI00117B4B55|nr:glycosyltransferase family 4 protein [Flavobacterium franklandianum]TRX26724.1 glycosyltransferase family 4 protein [Flavobacterium franklandianum]